MSENFIARSWRANNLGTRLLRLWLGGTWLYAGLQKAFDAGFFDKASATYIGVQISNFSQNSPVGFILKHLIEHAEVVGWLVLITELAIGIAVLSGVALQLAALGGALVSLGLWLSASWTVYPYFLGSDSAYFVMWVALLLLLRAQTRRGQRDELLPDVTDRRTLLQLGLVLGASVVAGIGGAAIGKLGEGASAPSPSDSVGPDDSSSASPSQSPDSSQSPQPSKSPQSSKSPRPANAIIALAALPVGGNHKYQAPDGNPAYVFRTNAGVFSYSAICTHQGCVVGYSTGRKTLLCPCHGGEFDPLDGGKVRNGPPPAPLVSYKVAIEGDYVVTA